jgi:acetylornithine deacetylase
MEEEKRKLEKLVAISERKQDRVVKLTRDIVRYNTTSMNNGEPPTADRDCQKFLAEQLERLGFEIDMWEPDLQKIGPYPFSVENQSFKNRPQLVARRKGSGNGRSLILNAHIDTVAADPVARWKHNPWGGDIVNGKIYGRGTVDMKGGAASIITALETIDEAGVELQGDIIVEMVLDEEINGMGTVSCLERGYRADAAVFPEPSDLKLCTVTRGLMWLKVTIEGRSGHAEHGQPHWMKGGAVNAVEKANFILTLLSRLDQEWQTRPDKRHPLLSTPKIIPTVIHGGDFWTTIPEKCEMDFDIHYLPTELDQSGFGGKVKREVEEYLRNCFMIDSWLSGHPPSIRWLVDYPCMELPLDSPIIKTVSASAEELGFETSLLPDDSGFDAVHLVRLANIPGLSVGPGPRENAHTIDEFVSIDSLSKTTKLLAATIVNWCNNENQIKKKAA